MAVNTELIERYEQGARLIEDAVRGVSPGELDRVPAPGKWTIRQLVLHVADADIMTSARIRAIAGEPGSRLAAFDQDQWAANMPYNKLPIEPALAVIRALREATSELLKALPPEAWTRTGVHSERGEVSVKDIVESIAGHAASHARQICEHRTAFAA